MQSNDIWVLAHFKNFNFSPLELNILDFHFRFGHDLNSNLLASLLVDSLFDQTKLTFAKRLLHFIEVEKGRIANDFLDGCDPSVHRFFVKQVVSPLFISWEYQSKRVEHSIPIQVFWIFFLDKNANQIVHALVLVVILFLVDIQLLAEQAVPILLEFGFCSLSDHLAFKLDAIIVG